ncbi:sulfate adenylyltransferase subunit CysN [Stappia taiwanensis]|uniref:Multifunctional fusion protein n=1 Tax=Stappia taiwanensis TaxID=992267 RepID=A0A838XN45_9HYPH|nr:sulfate adenylyltransferase subunit CysN [Stappia taiwanensis]MBA4610056.1 sulfate adenylyltransferase subunit CysN [Stappia taiwanensis]GGE76583.1 adenylyl-sulfate kinase [Stappia taiwanensis]
MNQLPSISAPVVDYLESHEQKGLLRFLTCGSVDDGKSTLIGRLLHDSKRVFEDQLAALRSDSRKHGTQGEEIDFALLVDGLEAEREQGITIDVAYRFFATDHRKFIVADTPGHEQYTRNMATGASTSDLAVILVDARKGILQQTRRHSFIVSLLGIRHVVVAVNKMDLIDFDADRFAEIETGYRAFAESFGFDTLQVIPISALQGDNIVERSPQMPWYAGPTLLGHLNEIDVSSDDAGQPFRMPVQWINRPDLDFRGYCGTIVSGRICPGDPVAVAASGQHTRIARIVTMDGDVEEAQSGDAVTLTLADEVDASRGDVICDPKARPEIADRFSAHLIWMGDQKLVPGRTYAVKAGKQSATGVVSRIGHRIDVNTFAQDEVDSLSLNEIGFCNLALSAPIAFDPYEVNREMGSFILIDRMTNQTVAAGVIWRSLRSADNIHRQAVDVDKQSRAILTGQKPVALWFTGLSGAGKSTIANLVERKLHARGRLTYLLDGDNLRHGLNQDLGFSDADRVENIRRVGEMAKLFVDAGLISLVSFISPFRSDRQLARKLFEEGEFVEIHVAAPLEVAEARDPKGLYQKAREGKIRNFTGIDSPYEPPEAAELVLDTVARDAEALADEVIRYLGLD